MALCMFHKIVFLSNLHLALGINPKLCAGFSPKAIAALKHNSTYLQMQSTGGAYSLQIETLL